MASIAPAYATTITGSYTAVNNQTGAYRPTINYDGGPFLSSPFSVGLTTGTTTATQTFLQIAPISGGSGTLAGSIAVDMTLTDAANSPVTGFYTSGGGGTLSNGTLDLTAYYNTNYGNQSDCVSWSSSTCTPTNNTTTIGETVTATFADGAVMAINLYNWSDLNAGGLMEYGAQHQFRPDQRPRNDRARAIVSGCFRQRPYRPRRDAASSSQRFCSGTITAGRFSRHLNIPFQFAPLNVYFRAGVSPRRARAADSSARE